jgi:hypothetical protein
MNLDALYVPRGGEQVLRPPFTFKNVHYYGFVLAADRDRLQHQCDRYLNGPSNATCDFAPVGEAVTLVFSRIDRICSVPDAVRGGMPEVEAAIWMPVTDRRNERLRWFHPYMLVDSSNAMAAGRELYGYAKSLGWMTVPDGSDDAGHFLAETNAVATFAPDATWSRMPLFDVRRTAPGSIVTAVWSDLREAAAELIAMIGSSGGPSLVLRTADDLLHSRSPMVHLKQCRDGSDTDRACFQHLVTSEAHTTAFHGGGPLTETYDVTVSNYASHPVCDELGIASGPQTPLSAFWLRFDMTIGVASPLAAASSIIAHSTTERST